MKKKDPKVTTLKVDIEMATGKSYALKNRFGEITYMKWIHVDEGLYCFLDDRGIRYHMNEDDLILAWPKRQGTFHGYD